jgi:hypothetical protein
MPILAIEVTAPRGASGLSAWPSGGVPRFLRGLHGVSAGLSIFPRIFWPAHTAWTEKPLDFRGFLRVSACNFPETALKSALAC